ncbi:MAG: ADP compounds hydrolase NudE [Acidiferrobacteraceae bacterium]|nr:ADP compounds hydrolase NudE [Acidiferrobacteraceae bacterium]|tara:strand:- start:17 stop:607 length:591 start_codon:yes stop_codon:yes gene_type:complete
MSTSEKKALDNLPLIKRKRTVATSRLFKIQELDLQFSNGHEAKFERLTGGILHPGETSGVLVVPVTSDDEILLIREYAAGLERYELGFVRGRIEEDELPQSAAAREMQEEIGLNAREFCHLATISLAPAYSQHRTYIYSASDLYESHLEGDEPEPIEQLTWKLSDIDQLRRRDDFTAATSVLATYLVCQEFSATDG